MDTIKNIVYAGLGLASMTTDKVKETVNDLVEKGKISDTEGKKIIDDIFKTTENKKEEFENKFKSIQDKIASKFDFNKKDSDEVLSLRKRIEELESKLAASKKSTTTKKTSKVTAAGSAKKSTAKKTTTK